MKFKELIDKQSKESLESKITMGYVKLLFPVVSMSLLLAYQYYAKMDFFRTIKNGTTFTCKSKNSDAMVIEVDLKDGWRLEDGYFIKAGSKIEIESCKKSSNEDEGESKDDTTKKSL